MPTETIDYNAVLADLEAKKAGIEATIAGIRQMLSQAVEQGGAPGKEQSTEVRFDSFFGMSMPDAVAKFLEMSKRPQTVSDMTKALQEGGFPTTAKNLIASVGSTLTRMKQAGDVVSVSGKWGMAAWYPTLRRERLDAVQKAATSTKPKRKKKPAKSKKVAPVTGTEPPSQGPTPGQIERIKELQVLGKKPGEIGKQLGLSTLAVWRALKPTAATIATA